ncbi:MAG: AarF/ABC1/UbiB kinase family protein [Planctomycetes bacterium]|nr:AarF/ABC1/UbiB kinase family protein [Planctomycetota bacterium]NOG55358.1 AarF/ABC1/UbiB kinase family protein [Planctomycetota bacterium]
MSAAASSSSSSSRPSADKTDSPSIAELIDAMPIDEHETAPDGERAVGYQQALQDLLADLALRPIPTNRLGRLWILTSLQAKIGAAYFAWWLRKWYKNADAQQRALNDAHMKAAFRMLGSMSYLRGAAMKFGQMLANYPDVMPSEFTEVLGSLHFEAPAMHYSLLREFITRELGRDPEDVFDDFETEAFAAASLGQVHRARLKESGRPVAVKVQYPNIARTIESDLKNLKAVFAPMRMHPDWDSMMNGYEDIRRMLALECDYEHEAENLRVARLAFADRNDIVVPRVYDDYSTRRVLTMDLLDDGLHLRQYLETNPSQEERDRYGELIAHSTLRLSYGERLLHADPHPANYVFLNDGRLGLLDFGCCVRYSEDDLKYVLKAEQAFRSGSEERIIEACAHAGCATPKQRADKERMLMLKAWGDWVWETQEEDRVFDFSDISYIRRGAEIYTELLRRRYVRSRPVNTWLTRAFFGIRAMLTELRARVNYYQIWREYSDRYYSWEQEE